jgi:hypothetical protein
MLKQCLLRQVSPLRCMVRTLTPVVVADVQHPPQSVPATSCWESCKAWQEICLQFTPAFPRKVRSVGDSMVWGANKRCMKIFWSSQLGKILPAKCWVGSVGWPEAQSCHAAGRLVYSDRPNLSKSYCTDVCSVCTYIYTRTCIHYIALHCIALHCIP